MNESPLDLAPCGYLTFSDDGTIREVNRTLEELLNYAPGELTGRRVEDLLPPGGRIFYHTHFFPLLRLHGKADEIYLPLRSKNQQDVPMLVNGVRRPHGGDMLNICVCMAIRQRGRFEDELLQAKRAAEDANRAKDEFLAMVSHELRTPIAAISGWAQMLRRGGLPDSVRLRALDSIERSAQAEARLIEDLLDLSRMATGRLRLTLTPLLLAPVVQAAVDIVRPTAEAKAVALETTFSATDAEVNGDNGRLQQVFWNLLTNAIKFTPEGGTVRVTLNSAGNWVEVQVRDDGRGIDPQFLPYIFERFRQSDGASTSRRAGLGLGLAICRHLIELHGGVIAGHSDGEGKGATFSVRLPLRDGAWYGLG